MKALKCLIAMSCIVSLTGCWDRVEIEEKGFVVGAAIDLIKDEEILERVKKEAPGKPQGKHRFILTQQFVNPRGFGTAQGSGADVPAFLNISSEGDTMMEMVRSVAARTSRTPFYEHIKVIIISEDVARVGAFPSVLDFFLRHPEMRRGTKIMIAEGKAKNMLDIEPVNESLPAMYIESISQNNFKNARMIPPTRIGDINENLLNHRSYIVQRVNLGKDEVKIAGNAVFDGATNKMVGFLGEEETEGRNFITGEIEGGLVEFKMEENLVVFDIKKANRSIKADVSDPSQITFEIMIDAEGTIVEAMEQMNMMSPHTVEELELQIEKEILRICEDVIKKTQKEFKLDALELGGYLQSNHYPVWNKIRKDWDSGENYFSEASIKIDVNAEIRNFGATVKTEK
jgi:spore germination protein